MSDDVKRSSDEFRKQQINALLETKRQKYLSQMEHNEKQARLLKADNSAQIKKKKKSKK